MAKVAVRDLVKVYGRDLAVRGIDLDIPDGAFAVFVGPSGCGKSTTLRMIAGLETISHGDLLVDGARVNDLPSRERGVAMVFQSYALYPHKTVRQNLEFSLKLEKLPRGEIARRVDEAVEVLELAPYLDRKPASLSGGQRQRVAMGRAIVRHPKVFLFDEPLSNLDAMLRNQMRVEIKRLQRRLDATMIYVTHDQVEAMTMADKIVVLQAGRVEQVGAPMDLYHRPNSEFVAGFIGAPSMNFLDVATDGDDVLCAGTRVASTVAGGLRRMGIRPEHIAVRAPGTGGLQAKVAMRETLGGDAYLYVRTQDDQDMVVRTDGDSVLGRGDVVGLELPGERLHFFDRDGRAVRAGDLAA